MIHLLVVHDQYLPRAIRDMLNFTQVSLLQSTNNIIDIEIELSEIKFPNGSDHAIIACYFEFYEEGEVEHINGSTHPSQQQRFAFKG